jgi:uncharacterized protein (DUF2237 family)
VAETGNAVPDLALLMRLERTHETALEFVTLADLKAHEWRVDA